MIFKRDNEFYIPCKTYCRYILNYVNVVHLVRVTKVFFNYAIIFRDTSAYVKYRHLWAARHLLGFRLREIENFVATCPLFYGASGKRTEEKRQIIRFVRIIGLRRATGAITRVLSLSPLHNGPPVICPKCLPRLPGSSSFFSDLRHDTIMKTAKCGIGGQFSGVPSDL